MAESAYLTRSIEQPHPLNKNFPGKVRDEYVKKFFRNNRYFPKRTFSL